MNKKTLEATFGEVYYAPECEDMTLSSEAILAGSNEGIGDDDDDIDM